MERMFGNFVFLDINDSTSLLYLFYDAIAIMHSEAVYTVAVTVLFPFFFSDSLIMILFVTYF